MPPIERVATLKNFFGNGDLSGVTLARRLFQDFGLVEKREERRKKRGKTRNKTNE